MSKLTMAKIVEIFADFLDAGVGLGRMFGVSFVKQDDKNKGTPKYSLQFHGTGDVEVALQKAKANNVMRWIHEASQEKLILHDGHSELRPNDDEVMFILGEIPPKNRVEMFQIYNNGTKEEFKRALVRLMIRPTKRMKFLKIWWDKIKPLAQNITLDSETKENINQFFAEKNKAMSEHSERLRKAYQPKDYNNRFINFLTNNWLVNMYRM